MMYYINVYEKENRMKELELAKILWNYLHLGEKIEKCDCILGLGCYDLHIPEKCVQLYKEGYADLIIFTGGLGKSTSEAETFRDIAINLGVPKEKILVENKSTNTGDNFRFTKKLIAEQNLSIHSFLIVQKPYMERRAYAAFKAILPDEKCVVTSPDISFEDYFKEYEKINGNTKELLSIMVGDLQRMKIYPKNGWQIEQDIPDYVWNAYEALVSMGYDKYVIKEDLQ